MRQNETRADCDRERPGCEISGGYPETSQERKIGDQTERPLFAEREEKTNEPAHDDRPEAGARLSSYRQNDPDQKGQAGENSRIRGGFGPAIRPVSRKKNLVEISRGAERNDVAVGASESTGARAVRQEHRRGYEGG